MCQNKSIREYLKKTKWKKKERLANAHAHTK